MFYSRSISLRYTLE